MGSLQELPIEYQIFLDKTTVLYGESKTGKSTVIIDILFQLKPHVDQIIVISPTDRQNHTYSGRSEKERVVPLPCIHYAVTDKLLRDLWERQEALVAVFTRANDPDIVKRLFNRLQLDSVVQTLRDIDMRRKEREAEIRTQFIDDDIIKSKIDEMEVDFNKLVGMIHKHYINENRTRLSRMELDKEEMFSLKYLNLNPRLVLVLDDCTEQLAKFKNNSVVQKIAFQGRWNFITTLIACHTDKNLDTSFKLNTFVSIFTEESCANVYFNRTSLGVDKEGKEKARTACKMAFTPLAKYQKLAWVREDKRFYRFTAAKRPGFIFGSLIIWEYCRAVQSDGHIILSDNKFASGFID